MTVLAKPLGMTTLLFDSYNANPLYAKAGDAVLITLVANGTMGSATATVASIPVSPQLSEDANTLTVFYYLPSSIADTDSLEFTITVTNEDDTATSTFTEANLTNSSIIIDNTAPSITLNGNNNTVVHTNSSYTDPGATASDSSYASDIAVTGTSNFDINKSGNYTFTYTAPNDAAGNLGPSIIRTVIVRDTPPIAINSFTIESNNGNSLYAKVGDELDLFLDVNYTIETSTVQIPRTNITSESESGNELYVRAEILNNDTESNATFTITVTNINGTTLTVTEDDLTSSNVFIDTVSPRIQLVGPAEYFIVTGTVDPIIPNVTVTDGDPNYSGIFTLDTNATIDTAINGSVYNYTYTADADTAGNLGESMSRIITITEADPITVTSLSITSSSGNNFANAGKTITVTLVTDGTDLDNFTATLLGRDIVKANINSGTATFTTTVFSNDTNGNVTFSITATNSSGNKILVTNDDITDVSFVTIDTIKPVIALVGASTVRVFIGSQYSDLGTTITDQNNPSYAGNISATSIGTSSLGSKTITYSAPADAAGNVPDLITRTVIVVAKPLGLETLTIESNNTQNNSYAKTGDKITITLVANGTIGSATTTIASNQITSGRTGSTLVVSYIVDSLVSDTNSLAFSIRVYNADYLNSVVFTEANLPGSSIIIDNTAPSITLVGNNNTIVATDSSYTDPGATASDSSYASDITLTGTSNFDITKSGNYTFTYTAEDEAGNLATSIRNVIVRDTPPIGITSFTISSSNDNNAYAKAGDEISFFLAVNNTINSYTAQIPNTNITNERDSGTELYIDADILNNDTESNATFTITVTNPNETTLTVTKDDLTSPNVFIDTISPRIQLVGHAEYFIVNGTVDPIIPGVNVTDGDPKYSGNFTLVTNATVDATINGSVYNYTYTAVADTAGNLGESVSRIITIKEAEPITVTSLSIASSSGNNFANAGKTITLTLVTDGTDLGNFTGTLIGRDIVKENVNSGTATFTTTVFSNDTNGNATFSITATNSSENRILVTNYRCLICHNRYSKASNRTSWRFFATITVSLETTPRTVVAYKQLATSSLGITYLADCR